jgi:hypothetical protein
VTADRYVRGTHPAHYRAGEWAEIVATLEHEIVGEMRSCWLVKFPDGKTDFWVVDDAMAGYEFASEVPAA